MAQEVCYRFLLAALGMYSRLVFRWSLDAVDDDAVDYKQQQWGSQDRAVLAP